MILSLRIERVLSVPVDLAVGAMWDLKKLAASWAPISGTELLYDDGEHQVGLMVVSRGGREERIRIVRFRRDTDIEFFNPVPPPMMEIHRGAWRFRPLDGRHCELLAERNYVLTRAPDEIESAYRARATAFNQELAERLGTMLASFQRYVEETAGERGEV
jgi:hypothetical protein